MPPRVLLLVFVLLSCRPCFAAGDLAVSTPWKYLMQGCAELDATHYAKAEVFLNKAVAADPKSAVALIQRGRCYYRLEKYTKAKADFEAALALQPGLKLSLQTLKFLISTDESLKDWKTMAADCERMIKLNQYESFAYNSRGKAHEKMGQKDLVQKDFALVHSLTPRNRLYWQATNLIKSENNPGPEQFQSALTILDRHIKSYPFDGDAYYQRACINSQLGRIKETQSDYDNALKYEPDRFVINAERARFLIQQKRYKEAAAAFTDSLQLAPGNDHLILDRAACYMNMGEYEKSIKDYTALSALHPEDEDPIHFRARVYAQTKQYAKALCDYDRVIYLAPDQAANYRERSQVYEKLGKRDLAKKDADKAAALLNGPIN